MPLMMNSDQLRERLGAIKNVSEFARLAGMQERTVYRVRNGKTVPRLDTAAKLVAGLKAMDRKARAADKAEA